MPTVTVQRIIGKRTNDEKVEKQVDYLIERGLKGSRGRGWEVQKERHQPDQRSDGWRFRYTLHFNKTSGQRGGTAEYNQWEQIKAMLVQTGQVQRFKDSPWEVAQHGQNDHLTTNFQVVQNNFQPTTESVVAAVVTENIEGVIPQANAPTLGDVVGELNSGIISELLGGVREIQNFNRAKTWSDLIVPDELLHPTHSDRALAEHPCWRNLYGINPQIRMVLNVIRRAYDTNGRSRNHSVLFGDAGCGKTTTLASLEQMFGNGSVLRLDATSTTRPGIEKLFFNDLTEIPPIVFLEEAEKADPEFLKVWLGVLDERAEIRKVNFRVNQVRSVPILFFCTVNNKSLFDKLMGSDGSTAGALSSRCSTQIHYPRPNAQTLKLILHKEIVNNGGELDWIDPCVQLAENLNISDPRVVKSFLAGGDRLMDGSYQRDKIATYQKVV